MARNTCVGIMCAVLVVASASTGSAQDAAAVKASPALVDALSKEIATPEQSASAAGALFGIARSRLKPEEFYQIANAVPGMDSLLKAVPDGAGALSQLGGSASGLATATTAFTKMGLKPDMVSKAIPVLTSMVSKSGGANVGNLLAGALK
jgi:hypothetical protein